MRDIVTTNGFSAAAVQTKSTAAKMPSNSGTLARPEYRSYRDFLESYNDNKSCKDDQESVSSTDSGISSYKLCESKSNNTSTSSLNSETNGTSLKSTKSEQSAGFHGSRVGSFRNYLETYNNKKFSSVKPIVPSKKNLVKSEIVIQVNDPSEKVVQDKSEPDSCCVTTINGDEIGDALRIMSPPVNTEVPNFPPPPPPLQLEESDIHECTLSPPPPPPPPPQMPNFANSGKKWATIKTEEDRPKPNSPEKLPTGNEAAANLAKILTQHILARRKLSEPSEDGCSQPVANGSVSMPKPVLGNVKVVSAASRPSQKSAVTEDVCSKSVTNGSKPSLRNGQNVISVVPPAPSRPSQNFAYIPVLPKLPVNQNGTAKLKSTTVEISAPKLPQTSPPKLASGRSSPVDFNTTTVVPVTDGTTRVSKADPNVKKLVYNTYRGLLGAYNNKANDMISTLPRNMVREDQGVAKQLESIALQGGLEKLNGRTNPNVEQE